MVDDLGGPSTRWTGPPARGSTTPSAWRTDGRRTDGRDPAWKRDFPYEAAAEEEVTRREFARYLVAGAGRHGGRQPRPRRVDPAAHDQHRRAPRELIPLDDVAVGDTYLFRYPTDDDPAILLRVADREVVAFSQKCTHLGCVVYFEADEDRWHCPCHEGNFDAADRGGASPDPRPGPSGASRSRSATTPSGRSGTSREVLRAGDAGLLGGGRLRRSSSSPSRSSSSPSRSRPSPPTTNRSPGRPPRSRSCSPAGSAAPAPVPASVTATEPPRRSRPTSGRCSPATSPWSWPRGSSPSAPSSRTSTGWPTALYAVAAVTYVVLVGAAARGGSPRSPRSLVADITSHAKGFAFLTTVAATNVLGSASGVIHGWWTLAWGLWWLSLALWAFFVYATLFAVVLKGPKPGLGDGINGTWFLLTVSTESIVVLGALLLGRHPSDLLAFALVAAFALGLVLYLIVMTMVFLRWTFSRARAHRSRPAGLDRRRRRRHHRARRLEPARRARPPRRGSSASRRSSRGSSCWPGRRPPSGSR